jgi:hypothetical protein
MNDLNPGFLILTLYLIISGNFMAPLLSCNIQSIIQDSMILRHLIGFLTFMFFVGLTNLKKQSYGKLFLKSMGLYALFVATTRMDIRFWVPTFICFAVLFLMENYKNIEGEGEHKEKIVQNMKPYEDFLVGLSVVLIALGFLTYAGAKKIEYKDKFNFLTFIFGKPSCRQKSPRLSIIEEFSGLGAFLK